MHNVPELPSNMEWKIKGYIFEGNTRNIPREFKDFETIQYIGKSGRFHHMIGDGRNILVCYIDLIQQPWKV